jgi:uroporphyrin-III C-methyltransferase
MPRLHAELEEVGGELEQAFPPDHCEGMDTRGKVYLVGAGPGDPELITVKGLRCLRVAEVVVYDRLVNPVLLDEVPVAARRIFVGKQPGRCSLRQEEINALLIEQARLGRIVVRLKGGDPFVFGRGGEEALALAEAGIAFEVVPGITSAIAVPAYAGIPVTQRGQSGVLTIVTGHETPEHAAPLVDWEALAKLDGTLVILMGVATLPMISRRLLAAGLAPTTPVAVIEQGTVAQQRMVTGPLAEIAGRVTTAGLRSPAVIVIGRVVELSALLSWFAPSARQEGLAATFLP